MNVSVLLFLISVILCPEYALSDLPTEEYEEGSLESFRPDRPRIESRAFDTLGGGMIPLMDRRRASLLAEEESAPTRREKNAFNFRRRIEERGFDTLGGGEIPWIKRRRYQ